MNNKQTIGELDLHVDGEIKFKCKTLELPWKDNNSSVSCIPNGEYYVKHRTSPKYGNHLHILDVPNRSYILMHNANFTHQLRGCVAVGRAFTDMDGDGLTDVTSSKATLKELVSLIDNDGETKLTILEV